MNFIFGYFSWLPVVFRQFAWGMGVVECRKCYEIRLGISFAQMCDYFMCASLISVSFFFGFAFDMAGADNESPSFFRRRRRRRRDRCYCCCYYDASTLGLINIPFKYVANSHSVGENEGG